MARALKLSQRAKNLVLEAEDLVEPVELPRQSKRKHAEQNAPVAVEKKKRRLTKFLPWNRAAKDVAAAATTTTSPPATTSGGEKVDEVFDAPGPSRDRGNKV